MGVRVVPLPEERAGIEALAAELGVRFPFEGPALRRMGGACVFFADGCRLHAQAGPQAKPRVCRQFPWVRRGEATGVDPACAHAHDPDPPPAELLGLDAPPRRELPGDDLAALAAGLEVHLDEVAAAWRGAPWAFWADQGAAGPLRRAISAELAILTPPDSWPSWPEGARAVRTAWRLGLCDDPAMLLVGAAVVAGAWDDPGDRRRGLAVWARGLR